MEPLPVAVYTAAHVRDLDRLAIDGLGIPGYVLMCRAGEAALGELRGGWPHAHRVLVLCGSGNNGGDGYVVARLARAAGFAVTVAALESPDRLKGDAARASRDFLAAGGAAVPFSASLLADADVVVDALFGTGLDRAVSGGARACIDAVNAAGRPVLAVDIPSGLHADSGAVLGSAIRAARTVTFVGLKIGLFVGEGPDHVGRLAFDGLAIPPQAAAGLTPVARRVDAALVARLLPTRRRGAHKGEHGRVLIVGGGPGMPGAARLAAEAALRSGAGLVYVATRPENVPAVVAGRPEVICHGIETDAQLRPLLDGADVVAVGPGLGQTPWARDRFEAVLASGRPMVLDADALNLLAQAPRRSDHWILTPHPGEAGRLLGMSVAEVQRDRLGALKALNERYGGVAVLKGAGSLAGRAGAIPWVCDGGNPGMATAGMGDVLTGIVAAIAAQCGDLERAAAAGVSVHAAAGDLAAAGGERGLLASDLFGHLRTCVNLRSS